MEIPMTNTLKIKEEVVRMHAQLCTGIADANRILIIYSLAEGSRNVGDLAQDLDMPQPSVSRHLKVLRYSGIVRADRDGQQVIYRLTDFRVVQALDLMRAVLSDMLKGQAALVNDLSTEINSLT
jgi:DNA-binding transcriptional ArsR family regulator